MRSKHNQHPTRSRASALVELMLVLPLLLVLIIGGLQFAWQFHVKHRMTQAAQDAARHLAVRGATTDQARSLALSKLSDIHATFMVTAVQPSLGAADQDVVVTITVPRAQLAQSFLGLEIGGSMQSTVTMRKEQ